MNFKERFQPMLFTTLGSYSWSQLGRDLLSGLIVAVIAIPLSIAFGIGAGVGPAQGLLTAFIAGFLISFFGGSNVQIGGPTGAFMVIIYGTIEKFGVEGLIIATLMAGIMILVLGLLRSGALIRYIPESIIVGFTAGIAVTIFTNEINSALGLGLEKMPGEFLHKLGMISEHLSQFNWMALILCLSTIAIIYLVRQKFPKLPGVFIALLLMSGISVLFFNGAVETIGSRYPSAVISFKLYQFPNMNLSEWLNYLITLLPAAFSIAMLGAIESLLSAVVADGMIGSRHRPNTELIAQGIANIASALFGGIPATGAIARTAANVRNGGRTPIAGISHAIFLLIIMVFFAPLTAFIPLAVLSGILMYVAINMAEWREFLFIIRTSRQEALVLLTSFLLTVLVDLVWGIGLGLLVSIALFIRTMADTSRADLDEEKSKLPQVLIPPGMKVIHLTGAFFFGASARFEEMVAPQIVGTRCLLLHCSQLSMIDASGIRVVRGVIKKCVHNGTFIMLSAVPDHVQTQFNKFQVIHYLEGHGIITQTIEEALEFSRRYIQL
jgi:SulP family sulfate permease